MSLFWLVPILPLGAFCFLVLGLGRSPALQRPQGNPSAWLAVAALAGSTAISALALAALWQSPKAAPIVVALPWMNTGGRQLQIALWLDPLGAAAALLVSVVGLVVFIYAVSYMAGDPRRARFFTYLSLFAGAMLTLVLAADLITLFIAWELVGICSYLLIGFWFERPGVPAAATKAFLTTRLGDLLMLIGVLLLVGVTGSSRIDAVLAVVGSGRLPSSLLLITALLLFAGAAGKSAQVPFQGWLPDAMLGPTPVSALLHSATMVAAGVFLVARLYPLFLAAGPALLVVAWVGAITALVGASAALVQTDLKRTLAYSTMSQLGLMYVGLGAGSLLAGVLLLVGQALFKALLFLAAGVIDHSVEGTGFSRMGGLARRLPGTFISFCIGAAALAGLPVTLALPPKDPVLAAAGSLNWALFVVVLLASLLTALYTARMLGLVFLGPPSEPARHASNAQMGLLGPVLVLAGLVPLGLLADAALLGRPLGRFFGVSTPESATATALGLGVAVLGTGIGLWAHRLWPTNIIWPPLQRVAPALAGEFGMAALYRAVPRLGLWAATALSDFDRRVFDAVPERLARMLLAVVRRASGFDRAVFDKATSRIASGTLALIRAGARFDLGRLDAMFNHFGAGLLVASQRLRALQTGRIENYLFLMFAWGLGALVLAAIFIVLS